MNDKKRFGRALAASVVAFAGLATLAGQQATPAPGQRPDPLQFKSGVELVNVTVTVSDGNGRFVPRLTKDDFIVYENDIRQDVTQFMAERVPVSLGIALDTSGSMAGDKMDAARNALNRFLYDLLDERDEIFLYRFSDAPALLERWTTDRLVLSRALARIRPDGGTALYDAVAEAVPIAEKGQHQKKALVIISDGNDTSSQIGVRALKSLIRESEVLVYAIGIDGRSDEGVRPPPTPGWPPPRTPVPIPRRFPPPGRRPPGRGWLPQRSLAQIFGGGAQIPNDDRVNVVALRDLTDDTGGRTEIVASARDLNPATASIADELSQQYYLGYTPTVPRDGQWHSIRVELREGAYRVRARRGYVAN